MNVSDEILGAYVDGELDASTRRDLEAAIPAQPHLAVRIAELERVRERLRAAFDPTLHEPLTPVLMEKLVSAGVRSRRSWAAWTAMAAGVAVFGVIGYLAVRGNGDGGLLRQHDNDFLADGPLAAALSDQLVSTQSPSTEVRIGLSFRNRHDGSFCRTFAVASSDFAGIACREFDGWHVRALAGSEHVARGSDGAQQAQTTFPADILTVVQNEMDGEPLDAAGEAAARQKRWRTE